MPVDHEEYLQRAGEIPLPDGWSLLLPGLKQYLEERLDFPIQLSKNSFSTFSR